MNKSLLELLVELYEVDEDRAEVTAKRLRSNDFYEAVDTLEQTLGYDMASKVISRGVVLKHIGVDFDEYMQLVREVSGKLKYVGIPQIPIFDSIDTLLGFNQEGERTDFSSLNLSNYRILHKDNPQSEEYLGKLISDGSVTFGISEHWTRDKRANGPRGAAIAKRIGHEINRLFDDLGMHRPVFKVNYGQRSIEVDDDTAETLRQVRDYVYNSD